MMSRIGDFPRTGTAVQNTMGQSTRATEAGVPQGVVLSLILFSIHMAELPT